MTAQPLNAIDIQIGARLRMRRTEIGMSQQVLGRHLGLTYQQIQKYEKGINRIGASRLQQIGRILEVPAAWFFEDAPGGWQAGGTWPTNRLLEFLGTHDGRALIVSFAKIRDARLRRRIVDLVERLAVTGKRRGGRRERK
jgi:transcriptional regulator with XRE-family HTH domain